MSENPFANPIQSSFPPQKPSKWQMIKDGGIVLALGVAVFFAGHMTGWQRAEASHEGEYSAAIEEIATDNQEEAERFDELTNICRNSLHARHSCRSSYRDANAKRISTVQPPPAQGPAAANNNHGGIVQAGGGSGST